MADKNTLKVWLQDLYDTEANLTTAYDASTADKTLINGRVAYVSDEGKQGWFKIGDGSTSFANLPYNTATPASHDHSATDITSGTLADARIPNLNASKITAGTLPVARGGTGKTTHTTNAVLTGNGTSAVNNVATKSGAAYATSENGALTFGTLPVAQGGTGATSFTSGQVLVGNGTNAVTTRAIDTTAGGTNNSNSLITSGAVYTAIQNVKTDLSSLMEFKGTLGKSGGSGTISALPTSGVSKGDSYKIIEENKTIPAANAYESSSNVTAKIGDTIVAMSTTPEWLVIPSGDEPSGTVTSVSAGAGLRLSSGTAKTDGGTITSSGTLQLTEVFDANKSAMGNNTAGTATTSVKVPKVTVDKYGRVTAIEEITVTTQDTDTKVTSAANHYTPTADSSSQLSVDASSTTAATWNSTSLVTGVNIQRDAKGHVTGVTLDSIKMPANPNTDVKVTQTNVGNTTAEYRLILSNSANDTTETNGVKKNTRLQFNPVDVTNATVQNSSNKDEGTLTVGASTGTGRIKAKLNTGFLDQATGDILVLNGNI